VLAEFEDKDLVPLIPMLAAGGYSTMCSESMNSLDDWKGQQIRVGSSAAGKQVTDLGATPVSLSFPETYEALDRKSTRLNSSHVSISYAVFCLKKKKCLLSSKSLYLQIILHV